jgi:ABC-type uncharacterized transport system ATPase subunit
MHQTIDTIIKDFRITPPRRSVLVKRLSGGNAQKVVAAREISRKPRLLIAHDITRGLDVTLTQLILQKIRDLANSDSCVIFITEDLDQMAEVCSRVIVLEKGMTGSELTSGITAESISKAIVR